jgi:hypothetical protein
MENITVPQQGNQATDFNHARRQAVSMAKDILSEPVIVAWRDDRAKRFGPEIPGGDSERWHDYGESHNGKLEMTVADNYHFIFAETADFEEVELDFKNIEDADGNVILCLNAACTEEDRRRLGDSPDSGVGD